LQAEKDIAIYHIETFLTQQDTKRSQEATRKAIRGVPYELEKELLQPDRERRWFRAMGRRSFQKEKQFG
jgi:hypothetical protein